MIKYLFFLFGAFLGSAALGCHMDVYDKVLKINNALDESVVKNSDCPEKDKRTFIDFLSSASGKMKKEHLKQIFKTEYGLDVSFSGSIEVVDLKDYVADALNLENIVVSHVTSLYGKASINLNGDESIVVECALCQEPGDRNIKLKIGQETIWLSSKLKIRRRGYALTQDVSPFSTKLDQSILKPVYALDDGKDFFFQDIQKIRFFRANKRLLKGQALKQSDLTPKRLVKLNEDVEVVLKGQNISLKTNAKARESGKYGERIKLFNLKTKKVILGTVIDFNTVMVEL